MARAVRPAFLSAKKQQWAQARAKNLLGVIVGKGIAKSSKADIYYRKSAEKEARRFIQSLIDELKASYPVVQASNARGENKRTKNAVIEVLKKAKKSKLDIYKRNMYKIIEKWLAKAKTCANKSIRNSLYELAGKQISINYNREYDTELKLMIERNVQLITNVASQTITNIENIVYDGMTNGEGWKAIVDGLEHQPEISARRIKLIARDQTAKTNQALNKLEQQQAGIKFFMWKTAGDERVSTGKGGHKQLDGKIYAWDEPEYYPVIDAYGHRGIPSVRPNCRCDARPVWILQGYEAVHVADGSYEIIRSRNNADN